MAIELNESQIFRCRWATGSNDRMIAYHDHEWGIPIRDDRRLFEMLTLEGAQAGLSWDTILRKRDGYRRCFKGFDADAVSKFGSDDIARLLLDPSIVRHRGKVEATVNNAGRIVDVRREFDTFAKYVWSFVEDKTIVNSWTQDSQLPSDSAESRALSKDLLARGFRFVGPTICYAFMQAAGLVNDHTVECFRYEGNRLG